jgi:hypothetical protein
LTLCDLLASRIKNFRTVRTCSRSQVIVLRQRNRRRKRPSQTTTPPASMYPPLERRRRALLRYVPIARSRDPMLTDQFPASRRSRRGRVREGRVLWTRRRSRIPGQS